MKILVGSTGFVGRNILEHGDFDAAYHRTDIQEAYGKKPDLLVYAGLPAAKFLANKNPEVDHRSIEEAERNIEKIQPRRLVLISTIDVLSNPVGADETTPIDTAQLEPYGLHRYELEQWVEDYRKDALIVRLPALFGRYLKKNFLFDFLHPIPQLLVEGKFQEFATAEHVLHEVYQRQDSGFYRYQPDVVSEEKETAIRDAFQRLHFSALNFTDSRSRYQFYDLSRLAGDIQTALKHEIPLLHLATEPLSAAEIYKALTGKTFINHLSKQPADYDYRTKYAEFFGGADGYIQNQAEVMRSIRRFIQEESK